MSTKDHPYLDSDSHLDIPEDAVTVRQSNWAWLWAVVPWFIFFWVATFVDFLTFGLFPLVLALIVIVPRYLSFRKTLYILTETHVIIQQGSLMGQHRVNIPTSDVTQVRIDPGMFGRTLGYTGINLELKEGRVAFLRYIPIGSPLVTHFQSHSSQ